MNYTKMHGAGNSFVLTENLRGELRGEDLRILALRLCDPQRGPGADGLIVLIPAEGADYGMLFFNSDGSVGEMCGNGARCAARYGVEHGLAPDPDHIRILAEAGLVLARRLDRERYELRLNDPSVVDPCRMAFDGERERPCAYVELGDPGLPHAVTEAAPPELEDLDKLREKGRTLRHSPVFPRGANVTFVSVTGENSARAITFERGVEDFTLACGTGSGATALCLILAGRIAGDRAEIDMPGGRLSVRLNREDGRVRDLYLSGPTAVVEEGSL